MLTKLSYSVTFPTIGRTLAGSLNSSRDLGSLPAPRAGTSDVMPIGSMDRYAKITRRFNALCTPSAAGPMPIRMQFHAFSSD